MKRNTVSRGISDRTAKGSGASKAIRQLAKELSKHIGPVEEGDVVDVLNLELIPVVRELRSKANIDLRENAMAVTAGDGAWKELWRSPELEKNATYALSASVKWADVTQAIWARAVVSNSITSANGVVAITSVDFGDLHYSTVGLVPPRWTADSANRQAVLEFKDVSATVMVGEAVVTMSAREF